MTNKTPLAVFMDAAGLKDAVAAKLLDVSPMTVRSWRLGSQRKPREAHQKKVVATFGHPLLSSDMSIELAKKVGTAWATRTARMNDARALAAKILAATSLEDAKELASNYLTPSDLRLMRVADLVKRLPVGDSAAVNILLDEIKVTKAERSFIIALVDRELEPETDDLQSNEQAAQ